jgi:hypothetical protein
VKPLAPQLSASHFAALLREGKEVIEKDVIAKRMDTKERVW